MSTKWIRILMAVLLIGNASCIHTQSTVETKAVETSPESGLSQIQKPEVEIQYLIYQQSKLPLGDFFSHLKRGDYNKAFRRIDFRYRSANFKDEAMAELLEAGFVPAYVKVKNPGSTPLQFDEKSFALSSEDVSLKAFYSDQLPKEFKRLSPKAVAANVYNTGVVIVGFAAVLAAYFVVASAANGQPGFPAGNGSQQSAIYNDVNNTVRVDYRNYLIAKTVLNPGEETKGILFFYAGDSISTSEAELIFSAQ